MYYLTGQLCRTQIDVKNRSKGSNLGVFRQFWRFLVKSCQKVVSALRGHVPVLMASELRLELIA